MAKNQSPEQLEERERKRVADHAGAGKYEREIDDLAERLFQDRPLTEDGCEALRRAVRDGRIKAELRNRIADKLVEIETETKRELDEQAAAPPPHEHDGADGTRAAGPRELDERELKALVKALKVGDSIWFFDENEVAVRAKVNHITTFTVTVEVQKVKDIKVYKGSILDVEAANE